MGAVRETWVWGPCGRPGYGGLGMGAVREAWVWGPCGRPGYGGRVGGLGMGLEMIPDLKKHLQSCLVYTSTAFCTASDES